MWGGAGKWIKVVLISLAVASAFMVSQVRGESLDAKGWFQKGNELSRESRFEEAVAAYQESIKLRATSPVAHYNLGIAYKRLGNYEEAAKALKQTVDLEPGHLDARLSLGSVYNRLERWEEAIAELNVVVHWRRDDPEAHGNLGWALLNYDKKPPFKMLVLVNLKKAADLFEERRMFRAADATRNTLRDAYRKFGYPVQE